MRGLKKNGALLALLVLVVAGCATFGDPKAMYGQAVATMTSLDKRFVETAERYNQMFCVGVDPQGNPFKIPGCVDRITREQYKAWADFVPKYQEASAKINDLLKLARPLADGQADPAKLSEALDQIHKLATDLALYAATGGGSN